MNRTSRMTALLVQMRRERNGAVADAMRYDGRRYGLNYGVSLPTVRTLARGEGHDAEFARLLYRQDVRELHLAALHIAEHENFTLADAEFFGEGIYNSEVAEEAAFALLWRVALFPAIFERWIADTERPLLQYAALLAASRCRDIDEGWLARSVEAVRSARTSEGIAAERVAHLLSAAVVTLLAAAADGHRDAVVATLATLAESAAERYIAEEMAWRMEM